MVAALIDTPVWSLAYRRKPGVLRPEESKVTATLTRLVQEERVRVIGPIRQEFLSGIREGAVFDRLCETLRAFEDEPLHSLDYETAALSANRCRAAGIAGSSVDMLICAVAIRRGWMVYTTDRDFARYSKALPLELFK